jgi:5-dehydro-2-deoxygluconokinase
MENFFGRVLVERSRDTRSSEAPDELHVWAIDHRWQAEEIADEVGAEYESLHYLKDLAAQAYQRVAEANEATGILLDDIYGEKALERLTDQDTWIARAIEVACSRPVELVGGSDVAEKLRSWPTEHIVKCMVYCHPQDAPDLRDLQERRVAQLYGACLRTEHQLLLEFQPPAGMDYARGDVSSLLGRFYELGVYPAWWKLPPDTDPATWQSIGDSIRAHDSGCSGILILGQGFTGSRLAESFAAAAREPLCKGFAVGRSIYAQPARRWLTGEASDEEFISQTSASYERMIELWRQSDPK